MARIRDFFVIIWNIQYVCFAPIYRYVNQDSRLEAMTWIVNMSLRTTKEIEAKNNLIVSQSVNIVEH